MMRSWTLRRRMLLGSVALAVVAAAAFLLLIQAVTTLRTATDQERRAKDITSAMLLLDKLVVDLETGLRGLIITRDQVFLEPWTVARARLPAELARFERLVADDPQQSRRARSLVQMIRDYERDYTVPLVGIFETDPAAASSPVATAEGLDRLNAIRAGVDEFLAVENQRVAATAATADDAARLAIAFALSALAGTALLIVLFGVYLARAIARPVRGVAAGATRLAGGDLQVRLDEAGPAEIRELTRSFNRMAEALARNRAELETQYERIQQSEQLKTELIAIVSHELRTPLASMLGFTSLILQRETDAETRMRYLEIVHAQGRRLAALLDDFLTVQRLEEGRLPFSEELVDVAKLLREQAELYAAESDRHRLELRLLQDHLPVHGDPDRLAQVVGNLLSNAIKYSPSGGRVEIVGTRANGSVRIVVRDEGLGIPESQRDKIFTKFFRGDAAASGITGSGLGLAFARAVVEAHGGQITFTSETGKGSTFTVELPRQAEGAG